MIANKFHSAMEFVVRLVIHTFTQLAINQTVNARENARYRDLMRFIMVTPFLWFKPTMKGTTEVMPSM